MAQRKLQTYDEYCYGPRSVLNPGDRFRVGSGPVYITDDGIEHVVAERGLFKFRRYCEQGAQKWIEAYPVDGGGVVLLWVGKACRSTVEPNLRRKPYKLRKVTDRKHKSKTAAPVTAAGHRKRKPVAATTEATRA